MQRLRFADGALCVNAGGVFFLGKVYAIENKTIWVEVLGPRGLRWILKIRLWKRFGFSNMAILGIHITWQVIHGVLLFVDGAELLVKHWRPIMFGWYVKTDRPSVSLDSHFAHCFFSTSLIIRPLLPSYVVIHRWSVVVVTVIVYSQSFDVLFFCCKICSHWIRLENLQKDGHFGC